MEATATLGFWSPRRFGQLLFRELVSGYRGLLIAMAAVGGTLIVVSTLTGLGMAVSGVQSGGSGFYLNFFQNLLFIGGFVVTSLAFREMWHNGGGIFYLTIPGSIFEKFTSKLLVTSVGYALGSTLFFTAAAALCEAVTRLLFGVGHGFFNPLVPAVLRQVLYYLALQSVFLLGSIWFRKLALVRTMLWVVIFAVAAGIVAAVAGRIVFAGHMEWGTVSAGAARIGGWHMSLSNGQLLSTFAPGTGAYAGLMVFKTIGQVLLWIMAPVFWLAAYFRLGESEV